MALQTVTLVLDETWRLISNTAGRLKLATESVDGALIVLGDVAPAAAYLGGQKDRQLDIVSLDTKAWARAAVKRAVVTVTRVVDAANHQEVILGDIGLSATSFAASILAGADVATITGRVSGDSIKLLPVAGGLVEASTDNSKLVRGLGPVSVTRPEVEIELEQSHPLAANSPKRTRIVVKVTGIPSAGGGAVIPPLPTPILLEGYDTLTGFSTPGATTLTLDTVNKVQGAGSVVIEATAAFAGTTYTEKALGTVDLANAGTISWYVEPMGDLIDVSGFGLQFFQGGTLLSNNSRGYNDNQEIPHGRYEFLHSSDVPAFASTSPAATTLRSSPGFLDRSRTGKIRVDSVRANDRGIPTLLISHDDGWLAPLVQASPVYEAAGIRATHYIPVDVVNADVWQAARDAASRGHCIGLDGTRNDSSMINLASEAALEAEIDYMKQKLVDNGITGDGWKHMCAPFGHVHGATNGDGTLPGPIAVASITSDGAAQSVLTFGAAANVTNGMKFYGRGVPAGTVVLSGGGTGVTTVTVNAQIPAGTMRGAFRDESAYWQRGRVQTVLDRKGIQTMRITSKKSGGQDNMIHTRHGIPNRLNWPADGMTNVTRASLEAKIARLVLVGGTQGIYLHNLVPGQTQPSINFDPNVWFPFVNEVVAPLVSSGQLVGLNARDWYLRDEINKA